MRRKACKARAKERCTKETGDKKKKCEKKSITRCRCVHYRKRVSKSVSTVVKGKEIPKKVPEKRLANVAEEIAIKKCGDKKDKKDCRKKKREEVKEKENKFREEALKKCDSKARAKKDMWRWRKRKKM